MKMKLTSLLIIINISLIQANTKCNRKPDDATTCFFTDITDTTHFTNVLQSSDYDKSFIRNMYFNNTQLTSIPSDLTYKYKNLEVLDASNVYLSRLLKYDISSDSKIIKLNVSFNKIHELSNDITSAMPKLENLDLSNNLIRIINSDAFSMRHNIIYLNLSNNNIEELSASFFKTLSTVKVMKLNDNKISKISGNFNTFRLDLLELHLQNNQLKTFDSSLVKSANYIDISYNFLDGEISFKDTQLTELNIRGNLMRSLQINSNLLKLDASDNTERSFEISFNNNIALTHLTLSNLDIGDYGDILKAISKLTDLSYLDLSENQLRFIDLKSAELPRSLVALNLERCDLHSMINWRNFDSYLPNLKELSIDGNFFKCDELQMILDVLEGLHVDVAGTTLLRREDFVSLNCAPDSHRKRAQASSIVHEEEGNKILWSIVIICLIGYVVCAGYYVNKKFDLIERIMERTREGNVMGNSNHHGENLLNEEEYP